MPSQMSLSSQARIRLLGCSTHPLVSEKAADAPPLVASTAAFNPNWQANRMKLLGKLALLGLGGTALGAGVAGINGLSHLSDQKKDEEAPVTGAIPLKLPKEKMGADMNVGSGAWWQGQGAKTPWDIPWAIPAGAAAGIGGMLGGSHLMNKYLHKKLKSLRQGKLDEAQQGFDQSMLEQYKPHMTEKVSAALDQLAAKLEKQGMEWGPSEQFGAQPATPPPGPSYSGSAAGKIFGPLAALSLLSGAMGVRAGYRWGEARKPENLLLDAKKKRDIMRAQQMPPQMHLQPMLAEEEPRDEVK